MLANAYAHGTHKAQAGYRRLVETLAVEPELRRYHRRRALAGASNGVFDTRVVCGVQTDANGKKFSVSLCSDGATCVAYLQYEDCPLPTSSLNPFRQVRWASHQVTVAFRTTDVRSFVAQTAKCWDDYLTNDRTNPFSVTNAGKTIASNPAMVWCFPLIQDIPLRFPRIQYDVKQAVSESCAGGTCACPMYSREIWDLDVDWIQKVPYFLKARLLNGLVAFQYLFVRVFALEGSIIDNAWWSLWSWFFLPDWWVRAFGDLGLAGSPEQKLFCALLHLGSLLYLVFMTYVLYIVWVGALPLFFYIAFKIILLVDAAAAMLPCAVEQMCRRRLARRDGARDSNKSL